MSADLPEWTPQQAIETTWGELIELRYGKSLKNYKGTNGPFPVFGTNGPIGYCDKPLCEYPSVVIGRKGAYRGVHFADTAFFVIDTAYYIEPKFKINLKWAYYYLLTADINGLDSGSAIPSTRREDFYSLPVRIPPLKTQNEIVRVLDSVNKKIQLNTQTNQTLESIAQAIFQSWFVDFEPVKAKMAAKERWYAMQPISESASPVCYADEAALPDLETYTNLAAMCAISGKSETELTQLQQQNPDQYQQLAETAALFPSAMVDSELGEIPEGWEIKQVGNYLQTISKTFPLKTTEEVIFLNTGDIQDGRFLHKNKSKVATLPGQAKKSIQKDDILYSEIRPENKRFAYVHFEAVDYVVSTKLMVLRANGGINSKFLYFLLRQQGVIDQLQIMAESRSGTFPQITFDVLSKIEFVAPQDNQVTNRFAEIIISPFMKTTNSNIAENTKLAELRDSLLPKLLSGEIDLTKIESEVT